MSEGPAYYITPWETKWQLKRVGGVKILKTFPGKEEALAYAQVMISKQHATFRIQNADGSWQAR